MRILVTGSTLTDGFGQEVWATRIGSCGVEDLGPGLEETCLAAHFTTASGDAIDNGHVFVDKSVAMKDLTMAARLAAVPSGRMRSANESVKVLLRHHAAICCLSESRSGPRKFEWRRQRSGASVNLNRGLTQLAQPT